MTEKLFITIHTKHPKLGNLLLPYLAEKEQQFLNNLERIVPDDSEAYAGLSSELSSHEQEIIRICNRYTERELTLRFGRPGESPISFMSRIDPDYIRRHIRPYIEKRITEVFAILIQHDLPIYPYDRHASLYIKDASYPFKDPATVVFKFIKTAEHIIYRQMIRVGNTPIIITGLKPVFVSDDPCRMLIGQHVVWFEEPIEASKFLPFFTKEEVIIPLRTERIWFEKFLVKIAGRFGIEAEGFDVEEIRTAPRPKLYLENNWQGLPCFRLAFYYDNIRVYRSSKEMVFSQLKTTATGSSVTRIHRNMEEEARFVSMLRESGLRENDPNHFVLVNTQSAIAEKERYKYINWVSASIDVLTKEGFIIDQSGYKENYYIGKSHVATIWKLDNDWFAIHLVLRLSTWEIPFVWLKQHILEKNREYILPDGAVFIIPEAWFSQYGNLFHFGRIVGDQIRIARQHATLLQTISDIPEDIELVIRQVIGEVVQETPIPASLRCNLRDYQAEGFQWMMHLRSLGLNGCLADDMGLGKTIQTIALLCAIAEEPAIEEADSDTASSPGETAPPPLILNETPDIVATATHSVSPGQQLSLFDMPAGNPHPRPEQKISQAPTTASLRNKTSLLVAPVTLLYNWRAELKRFAPHLKVIIYAGSQREKLLPRFKYADVVLCSYGLVRVDSAFLGKQRFHYLIMDESQVAKNPSSKTYKALLTLQSDHRLALSGTPVENTLMDLYALMNLLNRGLLGSRRSFIQEFLNPIRREPEALTGIEAIKKLKSLTGPFIMRRTKEQVADELPPKTEQLILCTMTPEQERIYEEELSKVRNYFSRK